jgi:mannose-1-phosphate guanylyltransferase
MKNIYFVILAGGYGERLWPLSKKETPKHLLPFLGTKSLLEQSIDRVSDLALDRNHLAIVTHCDQSSKVKSLVGDKVGLVIDEPVSKNTGAALLNACLKIRALDPDAIIVAMPADHFIPDKEAFCKVVNAALGYVETQNVIALLGVMPLFPATGYGYIQTGDACNYDCWPCYHVAKFHEKPNHILAEYYVRKNDMFWNIGIFVGQASVFIDEFKCHVPELYDGMEAFFRGEKGYDELPANSVDYAVMEKSKNVVIFPAGFEWYDVGNLGTFLDIRTKFSVDGIPEVMNVGGSGNVASSQKKLVACVGVSDLCIVETDEVILVVSKQQAEMVKQLLHKVREKGL